MGKLFLSHSSKDNIFLGSLRASLAYLNQEGWVDSRELRGGDPLWPVIEKAIEDASAFAVIISPDSLQSKWVGKELRKALEVRKQRGIENYPVIPLSLDGTRLGVLEEYFGEEPKYIPVSSDAGGVEAARHAILVALSRRLPAEVAQTPRPSAEALEELELELTDLKFQDLNGVPRASARARLVHYPAAEGRREVAGEQPWRLVAPLGPIEAEELRWYLEKYAIWPSRYFQERARKVEESLKTWGRMLHEAALPAAHTANVMQAWYGIAGSAGRRFSVHVNPQLEAGASEAEIAASREAAVFLLGLPWELLHDGQGYLFQGAKPVRVRRRLPNTRVLDVPVVATPIRILLITARPEDEACSYLDHRVSALPLVEAMECLPGLVRIHVLNPPTLDALTRELDRARDANTPYHVVHFDGHGVFDRNAGLGGLCFESPEDGEKLERRRHLTKYTGEFGPLLRDHRIPLVFLEACQTAQAEKVSESVASELLKSGVASVVAMSHSVLVETARRFVEVFYRSLAAGRRVGAAMLEGQRALKDDSFRGQVFGAGELRLEDWFVPVLFQEKADPPLFHTVPDRQTQEDYRTELVARCGQLPPQPATGFIGRSRELLALQRLLRSETGSRYAVVIGQGGEGKTALATEFARWMVRSHQIRRSAFVSVEGLEINVAESVLDKLGQQLLRHRFSTQVDCHGDTSRAEQEILRSLRDEPTLIILDNMESVLLPPFLERETPEALSEEARAEVKAVLALCARLLPAGETRLIFTSREALPAPFDAPNQRRPLHSLGREDAVKLVERTLQAAGGNAGTTGDVAREEIEQLVDAIHGHARTLALLAPFLQSRGVEATRVSLIELMAEMERDFPGSREQSLFASVELSLRRLSPENQKKARVLGVFHGGIDLDVLRRMMAWDQVETETLATELVATGLATPNPYAHLTLNPALCPYLRARLEPGEQEMLTQRWVNEMQGYIQYLVQELNMKVEMVVTLTLLELPNLLAVLRHLQNACNSEATLELASSLLGLIHILGKPGLIEWVGQARDGAEKALDNVWNHARFEAERTRIEQMLSIGKLREVLESSQALLERARQAGEQAYLDADYDVATAFWLMARAMKTIGGAEQALPLLLEARKRFEDFETKSPGRGAERMVSVCITERGDCLRILRRLESAAIAYAEGILRDEKRGDKRGVAVGTSQLGTVRLMQCRYSEALRAYADARDRFTQMNDSGSIGNTWHQTGRAHQEAGQLEAAEDAYRKSLVIKVQLGDLSGQASTLGQLGNLYSDLNRPEEAVAFYQQTADKFVEIGDTAQEGRARNNLAAVLIKLRRLDEARREIRRAIDCKESFGHSAEPWTSWDILCNIETEAGNHAAAAKAKKMAKNFFLAFRRAGGENHTIVGRISLEVTKALDSGNGSAAPDLLDQFAGEADAQWLLPFLHPLQAIVAGSRDRGLADAPELDYSMAAEILLLIESLDKR